MLGLIDYGREFFEAFGENIHIDSSLARGIAQD